VDTQRINAALHNPNGNLTSKTEGSDTWTYEWDAENRLKRVLKNAIEQARFAYDPLGRRVEKVAGGATTSWIYDAADILRETTGAAAVKYIHGPGMDEPLAWEDGGGVTTFFHADGLRSIVKTTNSSGVVTSSRRSSSFGAPELGATNGFAFTGREWDGETGLYYYRARYYDPSAGRFINEDPIGFMGGANFYAYVGNDPANWVDPLGLVANSANNRKKRQGVAAIAKGYEGSEAWNFNVRKDDFGAGTNKCNKFVCDVTNEAGAPMRFTPKGGRPRCPRAGEIANPNAKIPNWRPLGPSEVPEPGDVAAYQLPNGGAAYSGHSGIVCCGDNLSAHADGVYTVPNQFSSTPGVVFRRYTGE
jgi:RHS repeat-associated protein